MVIVFSLLFPKRFLTVCLLFFYSSFFRTCFGAEIIDNPLHCSCDTKELWNWLKDHRKCLLLNDQRLQCEQPSVLRGKVLTDMNPDDFCEIPLILDIAVQNIQPHSLDVSWAHSESSDLNGFEIFYQALDNGIDDVSFLFKQTISFLAVW